MAVITFRVQDDVKTGMQELCKKLGINLSTAYSMLSVNMVKNQAIPVKELSVDPFYAEDNVKELEKRLRSVQSGKFISKTDKELAEMFHV